MSMFKGKKTMKKEEVVAVEARNITYQWVTSRITGKDISFDDRMLNTVLETPKNGIRFYTKNKKCFDPNLYSERRFEGLFTKGLVITLVLEKSTTNVPLKEWYFQEMSISVRGGQDANDESDEDDEGNEEQEVMNVDDEESEEELEEEIFIREMRQKKRQERVEEGQSSRSMSQLMDIMSSMQTFMNSWFDALDGKILDIQERLIRRKKRCKKEVSRVIYQEAKDHSRLQDFMKMK
ncbi:hypothetical protein M9H77_23327 [Catharanthus roseus]|uniref:Uncharacterized protein n=1 Tax=Catharanthus roseus TaxID=4058 RepID=A0ACC0AV65_CATRO|nr:hypothetical protein M9H77_23327 [Catharanthus roseus]